MKYNLLFLSFQSRLYSLLMQSIIQKLKTPLFLLSLFKPCFHGATSAVIRKVNAKTEVIYLFYFCFSSTNNLLLSMPNKAISVTGFALPSAAKRTTLFRASSNSCSAAIS